mmetsp:Transcript_8127/g.17654  ORF Transcript_8127/g.17654 Transcript_8127/m.17654 type:complete len:88 (-) Transcript_8127:291-554(-)
MRTSRIAWMAAITSIILFVIMYLSMSQSLTSMLGVQMYNKNLNVADSSDADKEEDINSMLHLPDFHQLPAMDSSNGDGGRDQQLPTA